MSRVEPFGVGRVSGHSRIEGSARAVRRMKALQLEGDYYKTPEGRRTMELTIKAIACDVQLTNELDMITTLIADGQRVAIRANLSLERALEIEKKYFGMITKTPNALGFMKLATEVRMDMQRKGGLPTHFIVPPYFPKDFYTRDDMYLHRNAGPLVIANRENAFSLPIDGRFSAEFLGMRMIECAVYRDTFDSSCKRPDVDYLTNEKQIGEYFIADPSDTVKTITIRNIETQQDQSITLIDIAIEIIKTHTGNNDFDDLKPNWGYDEKKSDEDNAELFLKFLEDKKLDILIVRPFITYLMGSVIFVKGGADTGNFYAGHSSMRIGEDINNRVVSGNFSYFCKAVLRKPENVRVFPDAIIKEYVKGGNCKFMTLEDMRQGGRNTRNSLFATVIRKDQLKGQSWIDFRMCGQSISDSTYFIPTPRWYYNFFVITDEEVYNPRIPKSNEFDNIDDERINVYCWKGGWYQSDANKDEYIGVFKSDPEDLIYNNYYMKK